MQKQRFAALDDPEWTDTTWRRGSNESDVRELIRRFDFRRIREEIILRSPGLFQVPPTWQESALDPVGEDVGVYNSKNFNPTLPPRLLVDHLLQLYKTEVFTISPYVDFRSFVERTNNVYDTEEERDRNGIPLHASRSWLVVFFATLALTAQCIQDDTILQHYSKEGEQTIPIGWDFAEAAALFFGPVTKRNTLDDVRGALTLAIYFKQLNELGAANIWLGLSCKIAQYLGIIYPAISNLSGCHRYSPGLSREEEEARAYVWWDIYIFDRLLP